MTKTRRHAAIVFTDIVGYTALMGSDEDKAFEVLRMNREIHFKFIEQFNGTLIKEMGDGMLISFDLASEAVRCAIEIQKASKTHDIPLKIGIHEGEMVFEGNDVLGDGVNVASRIQDDAEEGCIMISGAVYRDIKNKADIQTEYVGERLFKNVDEAIKIYKVFCEDNKEQKTTKTLTKNLPEKKSIIVLPFVNMSPEPDQEYFSDGLTEEIITDLSCVKDLLVISRSSAMSFKGTNKKIGDIAKEVNVRYVLEGSVRKAGNNLRIIAQLIDANKDTHLWAEKYNGDLVDVFDIQEKVSKSIAETLKIKLMPEEQLKIKEKPIDNFQAYDLHIKAQNLMLNITKEGFDKAIQYLEKGLEIIGENEILYADLGQVYLYYLEFGFDRRKSVFTNAEKYIDMVFSLNPESSHGYYLNGHLSRWKGLIEESIQNYRRALVKDTNHINSLFYLAWLYTFTGKEQLAIPLVKRIADIDPLNPMGYFSSAVIELFQGQTGRAVELFQKAYFLEESQLFRWWCAKSLAYNGQLDESIQWLNNIVQKIPKTQWTTMASFFKYALKGTKTQAIGVLTDEFKEIMKSDELYPIWMAETYALLEDTDQAIIWLEEGIRNHFLNYQFIAEHDILFEKIRKEQKFQDIIQRMKNTCENFKF